MINGDRTEFNKLQSLCNHRIPKPDKNYAHRIPAGARWGINKNKIEESYYLNPQNLVNFGKVPPQKTPLTRCYNAIVKRMDFDLEKQLGFDWKGKISEDAIRAVGRMEK